MQKQPDLDDVKQPSYKSMHAVSKASRSILSVIQRICPFGHVVNYAVQEEMARDANGQSATRPDEAISSSQSGSGQSATDRQQAEASTSQVSRSFVYCSMSSHVFSLCFRAIICKALCWGSSAGSAISVSNVQFHHFMFGMCQLVHDSMRQHLQVWLEASCIYGKMETCGLEGSHVAVLTRDSTS